jgi:hypothetical protein
MQLPAPEQSDFKAALLHKNYPDSNSMWIHKLAEPSMLNQLFGGGAQIVTTIAVMYSLSLLIDYCECESVARSNNDNKNDIDAYISGRDSGGDYGGDDSD